MSDFPPHSRSLRTPCIGVCSTGIGDSVCRGCKRFLHEVVDWNAYGIFEKQSVLERIETLLNQIISDKLKVVNEKCLLQFLSEQNINCDNYIGLNACVFALLKAGAEQMGDWQLYGVELKPAHADKSPRQIRDEIDRELYLLSCAHYQRYFKVVYVSS